MKRIDLEGGQLVVPDGDPLEIAQNLQLGIAEAPLENQVEMAMGGFALLGDPTDHYGPDLHITPDIALLGPTNKRLTLDEELYPDTLLFAPELIATPFAFSFSKHPKFRTICLEFAKIQVLQCANEPGLEGQSLDGGLRVPVSMLDFAA